MAGPSFSRDRCTHAGCAWNYRSDGKNLRNHIKLQHDGAKPLVCGVIAQSRDGWMTNHLAVCNLCRGNDGAAMPSVEESAGSETVQSSSNETEETAPETGHSASVASGTEAQFMNNAFNNVTIQGNFSLSVAISLGLLPSSLDGQN